MLQARRGMCAIDFIYFAYHNIDLVALVVARLELFQLQLRIVKHIEAALGALTLAPANHVVLYWGVAGIQLWAGVQLKQMSPVSSELFE